MKLELKAVLVRQSVKLHTHEPGDLCGPACGINFSDGGGTALYTVNATTGECQGEIEGSSAHVDPTWWKEHCARVGKRVAERLKDIKL